MKTLSFQSVMASTVVECLNENMSVLRDIYDVVSVMVTPSKELGFCCIDITVPDYYNCELSFSLGRYIALIGHEYC